jgi:hypothetical protein
MLSILKEDYKVTDLIPAIENITKRELYGELVKMFNA